MSGVEGVWKNFSIKFIEKPDIPRVYEHLRTNFCRDETVCSLMGGKDDFDDWKILYDWVLGLDEKLCLIAVDNWTGEIAGVRITFTHRRDTVFEFQFKSEAIKTLFKIVAMCDAEANVFERYGLDYFANFTTASTGRDYRNQGLAMEMYKRSLLLLRERGFPLVKSVFTSPYARRAAKKLGFVELSRVYFKDIKDENGVPLIPNAGDEDFATFECLKL